MKVGKFISNHKLLCSLTFGFVILGYMGYKAVKWIAVKLGIVKKIDKMAQEKLSSQETNKPDSPNLKDRKVEPVKPPVETIPTPTTAQTPAVERPEPIEEHLKIVQSPKLVTDYLDEEYKGNTPVANKCRARLQNIEKHYDKHQVYPVRGDGNCFCNAAVAGLLSIPKNRDNLIRRIDQKGFVTLNYIMPDPNYATGHLVGFKKFNDFLLVIKNLKNMALTTKDLLEDFNFTAAFSRIIRYILNSEYDVLCSITNGDETDMHAIWLLNDIFNINAKMVVLVAPSSTGADPDSPESAYVAGGRVLNTGVSNVDLTAESFEPVKPEFLIVRKSAHFITLT